MFGLLIREKSCIEDLHTQTQLCTIWHVTENSNSSGKCDDTKKIWMAAVKVPTELLAKGEI